MTSSRPAQRASSCVITEGGVEGARSSRLLQWPSMDHTNRCRQQGRVFLGCDLNG